MWGKLMENLKLNNKMNLTYRFWFVLRRIVFIGTCFITKDNFTLQYLCLSLFNLAMTLYQGTYFPFKDRNTNKVELFNEFLMSISSYHIIFFSDMVDSLIVRYQYGWSLIAVLSVNLVFNMYIILKAVCKQTWLMSLKYSRVLKFKIKQFNFNETKKKDEKI